jgi:ATP-dependent Clp protease ATP-binding subunit ClpB
MIFLTSNLGASQMSSILNPKLGFAAGVERDGHVGTDEKLSSKIERAGEEAARRKFTPEFMNRLDKIVVFQPLGDEELRKILDIELNLLQRRVFDSTGAGSFVFTVSAAARDHLLREGTDLKYGARHLKRAIERLVVHPMSNLIATEQLRGGDWLVLDYDPEVNHMLFFKQAENLAPQKMVEMTGAAAPLADAVANGASAEPVRTIAARNSRRV